jgi:hypothetical protein
MPIEGKAESLLKAASLRLNDGSSPAVLLTIRRPRGSKGKFSLICPPNALAVFGGLGKSCRILAGEVGVLLTVALVYVSEHPQRCLPKHRSNPASRAAPAPSAGPRPAVGLPTRLAGRIPSGRSCPRPPARQAHSTLADGFRGYRRAHSCTGTHTSMPNAQAVPQVIDDLHRDPAGR